MATVEELLTPAFPAKHVKSAVQHFNGAVNDIGRGNWEDGIAKTGKFTEAILKAIAGHCRVPFDSGRKFKADAVINALSQLPQGSFDDSLRILIPRVARVVYDVASNRGARHDPHEVDPNVMDANLVMPSCSWILAELIRNAQRGVVDPSQARDAAEALVERKYPAVEEVGGRIYLHKRKKSAPDVALAVLAKRYPKRVAANELVENIRRNGFSEKNAKMAVGRMGRYVDDAGADGLRLLAPGLRKAEEIIAEAIRES